MRKLLCTMIILSVFSTGCADTKEIDGKTYKPYGLINKDSSQNPNIEYKPVWGNIVWGTCMIETIIAPIYFFGFSMFEPIGKIDPNKEKGEI